MAGRIGGVGLQKVRGELVVAGVGGKSCDGVTLDKGSGVCGQAVGSDCDPLVVPVEQIEGVGGEIQVAALG